MELQTVLKEIKIRVVVHYFKALAMTEGENHSPTGIPNFAPTKDIRWIESGEAGVSIKLAISMA